MTTTSMQFGQSTINVVLNEGQMPAKLSTDASGNTVLVGRESAATGLRYAILGDSFGARNWISGLSYQMSDYGYLTWANYFLGSPFAAGENHGVSGENTTEILARVQDVIDYQPHWCFVNGGVNDVTDSIDISTSITNAQATCQALLNAGIKVCLISDCPYTANADSTWRAHRKNAAMREWCRYKTDIVFVDCYGPLVDPSSATGALATGMSDDALHPSAKGARAMGYAISQAISGAIDSPTILPTSASETYATSNNEYQLYKNPLFIGTTGTEEGAATGDTATGWIAGISSGTFSGGCANSLVARADGYGNNQRLVCSGGSSGSKIIVRQGSLHSRVTIGKSLYMAAEISLTSATDVAAISFYYTIVMDGVSYNVHALSNSATTYDSSDLGPIIIRTPDFLMSGSAVTTLNTFIVVTFGTTGTGAATFDIGRAALYQH